MESRSRIIAEIVLVIAPLLAAMVANDLIDSERTDLPGGTAIVQGPLPLLGLAVFVADFAPRGA